MEKKEFNKIRLYLGMTQKQLSYLLGISMKTIESYAGARRNIPPHVERQMLLYSVLKNTRNTKLPMCWDVKKCNKDQRESCPTWDFQCGNLCWFLNGTMCEGKAKKNWKAKIRFCRKCEVFQSVMPTF